MGSDPWRGNNISSPILGRPVTPSPESLGEIVGIAYDFTGALAGAEQRKAGAFKSRPYTHDPKGIVSGLSSLGFACACFVHRVQSQSKSGTSRIVPGRSPVIFMKWA